MTHFYEIRFRQNVPLKMTFPMERPLNEDKCISENLYMETILKSSHVDIILHYTRA